MGAPVPQNPSSALNAARLGFATGTPRGVAGNIASATIQQTPIGTQGAQPGKPGPSNTQGQILGNAPPRRKPNRRSTLLGGNDFQQDETTLLTSV